MKRKVYILVFISGVIFLLWVIFFASPIDRKTHYSGKVKEIRLDDKEYPWFKIENDTTWYPIYEAIGGKIKKGDSVVKKSGSTTTELYRYGKLIRTFH